MNKKKIFAPFALLGAFLLAGCSSSTIVAKPEGWDSTKIIDKDVKDNNLLKIYTAIKELGDTNSNVLNNILFKISTSIFGEWNNIFDFGSLSFDAIKANKYEEFKTFVNKYKDVYMTSLTKKFVTEGGKVVEKPLEEDDKYQIAYETLKNVYNQVLEDSYKALYTEITGGTYSVDNIFHEEKYVTNNLFKNMYIDLATLKKARIAGGEYGTLTKEELPLKLASDTYEKYVRTNLRIKKDDDPKSALNPTTSGLYGKYFERKLIKDVFRTLLIQNYVKTQRTSTLGRTYARKINMISVPAGGVSYSDKVGLLFKNFVKSNIINKPTNKYDFTLIDKAMRGFVGTDNSDPIYKMLKDAGFELITVKTTVGDKTVSNPMVWNYLGDNTKPTHVFKGTKLGDLVEKYLKVYNTEYAVGTNNGHRGNFTSTAKSTIDETSYNDLTGTNSHLIEEGLTLKEREINKTTYIKEGWYLKSGTIADLDADSKERLFSIDVSLQIDKKDPSTYESTDYVRYYKYGNNNKHAFLTTKLVTTETEENLLILDGKTNYTIVEVEEAVSNSKFSEEDSRSYIKSGDGLNSIIRYNKIMNDVVVESSKGDTYKKNANQFYLMLSNIVISDQSLYDYMKGQFPDLFNN